jgi:TRAP-type mannitol/chloroaromatic compound transport system substrate-binding protein
MGAAVTILPGGEIVPALDRGLIDAAEFNNPSSDILLGFTDVSKVWMVQSHHQQAECFEVIFNKPKFDALPSELKAIIRNAMFASTADQFAWGGHDRYSKDLQEIKKRGVRVIKTPDAILDAQLTAYDKVIEEHGKDPFFKKVIDSQKAWCQRTSRYFLENNLGTADLTKAYTHFFKGKPFDGM